MQWTDAVVPWELAMLTSTVTSGIDQKQRVAIAPASIESEVLLRLA